MRVCCEHEGQRIDSFAWDTAASKNECRGYVHSPVLLQQPLWAAVCLWHKTDSLEWWWLWGHHVPSLPCSLASAHQPSCETAPQKGTFTSSGHIKGLLSVPFWPQPSAEPADFSWKNLAAGSRCFLAHLPVREMSGFPLLSPSLIFYYPLTSTALTSFLEHPLSPTFNKQLTGHLQLYHLKELV